MLQALTLYTSSVPDSIPKDLPIVQFATSLREVGTQYLFTLETLEGVFQDTPFVLLLKVELQ